jgi:hypothetical protein
LPTNGASFASVVRQTVAQAIVEHRPDATATEAYYHVAMGHLAHLLWRLGAAHLAIQALSTVLRTSVSDARSRLSEASATTRQEP